MRLVILKPEDCHFDITQLLSACLLEEAQKFNLSSIVFAKTIEELQPNDLVLYRFSSDFQHSKFQNSPLCHIELSKFIHQIENKGCITYPSSYMLQFYENKKRMYELFEKHHIKFPKTFFVNANNWRQYVNEFTFPILIKHSFSCSSQGMKQVLSLQELENVLQEEFKHHSEVLLQNKIIAKKEARISYFGESLYHGYYRIRNSIDDMSAATSFGSFCDYTIDLQKHQKLIDILNYDLGIAMGGVDILWENDDELTEPYVLEVSPIFEVNPPTPSNWNRPYKDWKEHPDFYTARIEVLRKTAREYIQFALKEYQKPRLYVDIDHTISNSQERIIKYPTEYHLSKYVLEDKSFPTALKVLNDARKTYSVYFLSARNSYENPFFTTRDWLFNQNIVYRGLLLCDNLLAKCHILSMIDKNIPFLWIDDCTVSDSDGGRCLDMKVIQIVQQEKFNLQLIESDDSWKSLQLT